MLFPKQREVEGGERSREFSGAGMTLPGACGYPTLLTKNQVPSVSQALPYFWTQEKELKKLATHCFGFCILCKSF